MSMEDLWLRQSVHGLVLFLGIKSIYSDKSERNYRGKCLGWPATSYGGTDDKKFILSLSSYFNLTRYSEKRAPVGGVLYWNILRTL